MNQKISDILRKLEQDADGIYNGLMEVSGTQLEEIQLREEVASRQIDCPMDIISGSHSIPVMDHEVDRFLRKIPQGAIILDIGGCWGWHWRYVKKKRQDLQIIIVDFVRSNLTHAQKILAGMVGSQIYLLHADATKLPFILSDKFSGFDAVWTVQTFQHIPAFSNAVLEAHRVLKKGGLFINYSLNDQPPVRLIYKLLNRKYVVHGHVNGSFWLSRASNEQENYIAEVFNSAPVVRWSEILFSPEFRILFPGRSNSHLGIIDSYLSNNIGFLSWFARQKAFECVKN